MIFINPRLVDTRGSYKHEATTNLDELKTIMEKLVVKDTPKADTAFRAAKPGGSVWAFKEKIARTFAL